MPKLTVLRHTFEEVLKTQEELRMWLDELMTNNRLLVHTTEAKTDEVRKFTILLARSTLGFGHRLPFKVKHDGGGQMTFYHAHAFMMEAAYCNDGIITDDRGDRFTIEPRAMWRMVQRFCFRVFPEAQDHAASMSPERIPADEFRHKYVGTQNPYDYQTPESTTGGPS